MRKALGFYFLLIAFSSKILATEIFEMHRNARALGMGNAYSSVVDDEHSLYYNPAGIAKNGGIFWSIVDAGAGINGTDAIDDLSNMQGTTAEFTTALNNLYGEPIWVGGSGHTAVILPFFAASYFYDADTSLLVKNPPSTQLELNLVTDEGIAVGTGFSLGFFQFGLVGKRITRTGDRKTYGAATLSSVLSGTATPSSLFDTITNEGVGYALDMGLNFSFDTIVSPTVSFVVKDIGNTSFRTESSAISAPPTQDQEMILGFSLVADLPLISFAPAIEFKHLDNSDEELGKKVHMGVELGIPFIDIRAGFHQGYFSYGAGFNLGLVRVDAASWGVELGEYPGQLEDRRYMVQATVRFGFDFGFGGNGSSASGGGGSPGAKAGAFRKIKRRR